MAEVPIQALLNRTSERIIYVQKDVLKTFGSKTQTFNLILNCKWGFGGSSGHRSINSHFKIIYSQTSIFFTSLVPIRLTLSDKSNTKLPTLIVKILSTNKSSICFRNKRFDLYWKTKYGLSNSEPCCI